MGTTLGWQRRSPQVELVHHVVFRPATSPLAQVGLEQEHFVDGEFWSGVDGEGVGVVVEKQWVPGARPGAGDGEMRTLAAAGIGVKLAVRHEVFEGRFIAADADPHGAAFEAAGAPQMQAEGPSEGSRLGEMIGDQVGVVGLVAVKRQRDVPIVRVRPAHFGAGEVPDGAQGGDEVFADFVGWDDRCEEASHGPHATLDCHVRPGENRPRPSGVASRGQDPPPRSPCGGSATGYGQDDVDPAGDRKHCRKDAGHGAKEGGGAVGGEEACVSRRHASRHQSRLLHPRRAQGRLRGGVRHPRGVAESPAQRPRLGGCSYIGCQLRG